VAVGRGLLVTWLALWGPTLVLAIALLSAGAIFSRGGATRGYRRHNGKTGGTIASGPAALSAALRQAEKTNGFRPGLSYDPVVHLRPVIRISPDTYQDGVAEIPHHFSNGHVISVDVSLMSAPQAARLIDFCSGYLVGTRGWLFRAAEKVIVLTPIIGKTEDAP
jgi:hypothetical protein